MSVKRLVPLNTTELSSDPSSARAGDIYYNSTAQELRVYTGTEWKPIGGNTDTGLLVHQHTYDGDIYSVEAVSTSATFIEGGTPESTGNPVDGGTPDLTGTTNFNIVDGGTP
jgi:hypothetical protein